MPYNNIFLAAALKPRMHTDIYIYVYMLADSIIDF